KEFTNEIRKNIPADDDPFVDDSLDEIENMNGESDNVVLEADSDSEDGLPLSIIRINEAVLNNISMRNWSRTMSHK
ncbi:hypothetical protein HHI36_013556, partial [Cryptolaemus montrouzieri]